MDDTFTLYDLKVEVVASDRPMVCSHKVGDYFLVQGENLVFQKDTSFSMYSLSALLPLLPARFKITRIGKRIQSHGQCTVVPLWKPDAQKSPLLVIPRDYNQK